MEGGVEGGLEIYRLGRDCCRWGSPWTVSGVCWVRARVLADVELGISDGEALMNEKERPGAGIRKGSSVLGVPFPPTKRTHRPKTPD